MVGLGRIWLDQVGLAWTGVMEGWINGGRGFQGRFYPSDRQRVVIGRTYKSLTRQITRQEPSATRQVFIRHCFLQGWIVLPRRGGIDP